MRPSPLPLVIAEWPRNARDLIRVQLTEYQGTPVIDVRSWYRDGAGFPKPSKTGITLGVGNLPRLAEALSDALAEAERLQLIDKDMEAGR